MSFEGQPLGVSGSYRASPVTAFLSARQRLEGFSGDVTLETADDVALGLSLGQASVHVGDGAWFVLAEWVITIRQMALLAWRSPP